MAGGLNAYRFAPNAQAWVDPLGLEGSNTRNQPVGICTRRLTGLPISLDLFPSHRVLPDLGIFHEHIFFKNGDNIGFTTSGLFKETNPKYIGRYRCSSKQFDERLLRQAINDVQKQTLFIQKDKNNRHAGGIYAPRFSAAAYHALGNNCQSFVTAVEKRYNELLKYRRLR